MSKIVFGPITSRRFGQSLGIDLSPHKKQCNFDCIYCELKGEKPVDTIENPPLVSDVVSEVKKALLKYKDIDVITLTANGEPTLYPYLEELIKELHVIKGSSKLLILSNGATSTCKATREILTQIDIVKLSLDCVSELCFKKIDRPLKGIHVKDIVEGIKEFRKIHKKELVLEVLVVEGINDKESEFELLREVLKEINPDRIDLSTVDRPPAYDVKAVSIERLKSLAEILTGLPISLAYKKDYSPEKRDFSREDILDMTQRRPQSFEDVHVSFSDSSKEVLKELLKENILEIKDIAGVKFYKIIKN